MEERSETLARVSTQQNHNVPIAYLIARLSTENSYAHYSDTEIIGCIFG